MADHSGRIILGKASSFIQRESICLAAICGILLGCIPSACFIGASRERRAAAYSEPKRYELEGIVKSVNADDHTAIINHDKVGDYMPPMTMTYKIKDDKGFAAMREGDHIKATLVVTDSGEMWLENVTVKSATQ